MDIKITLLEDNSAIVSAPQDAGFRKACNRARDVSWAHTGWMFEERAATRRRMGKMLEEHYGDAGAQAMRAFEVEVEKRKGGGTFMQTGQFIAPAGLKRHPASAAWKAFDMGDELEESIRKNGVRQPVVVREKKVVAGWNRYQIAQRLGIACPAVQLPEGEDPVEWAFSENSERRHVPAMDRAVVALRFLGWVPKKGEAGRPSKADQALYDKARKMAVVSESTMGRARNAVRLDAGLVPEPADFGVDKRHDGDGVPPAKRETSNEPPSPAGEPRSLFEGDAPLSPPEESREGNTEREELERLREKLARVRQEWEKSEIRENENYAAANGNYAVARALARMVTPQQAVEAYQALQLDHCPVKERDAALETLRSLRPDVDWDNVPVSPSMVA